MIPFNKRAILGTELDFVRQSILEDKGLSGDGPFTKKCHQWLESNFGIKKALLTPSCTAALEMSALLAQIVPGDEVIMPSYTFVSTANAFVLRGAKIVFVDVRPDTMNMDENLIEAAIGPRTKAIVPVHYAGVACEMDLINEIGKRHGLLVIEDAAQGMMAKYKGRPLGSIGHVGCYSFHESKNYTSGGEGGALLINAETYVEQAEIMREKGTDRSKFIRGQVDKYSWRDVGSSFLPSEIQAAYLLAQLNGAEEINRSRLDTWNIYHRELKNLADREVLEQPVIPEGCEHNAHMYFIKLKDTEVRDSFISFMREHKIQTYFHYVPLHSSTAGKKFGVFNGVDRFTTKDSERLVRLPLWYGMSMEQVSQVVSSVQSFFLR